MSDKILKTGHDIKHILVRLFEQKIHSEALPLTVRSRLSLQSRDGKYELARIAASYLDTELPPAAYEPIMRLRRFLTTIQSSPVWLRINGDFPACGRCSPRSSKIRA